MDFTELTAEELAELDWMVRNGLVKFVVLTLDEIRERFNWTPPPGLVEEPPKED